MNMDFRSVSAIVEQPSVLLETNHARLRPQRKRKYGDITIDGDGFTVVGDAFFSTLPSCLCTRPDGVIKLGLCFDSTPQLAADLFVGRDAELKQMNRILCPGQPKQQRLVLGGTGGVGKTQLAVAYAKQYQQIYDSVIWLNASSQVSLSADLRLVAVKLIHVSDPVILRDEYVLTLVHDWLSDPNNTRWLLIFDNYDETHQYDVSKYCPSIAHGAVIITTRVPESVRLSSGRIYIQPLTNLEERLDLLCRRSERRNTQADIYARLLVERLSGLPLALAMAGAYLSKNPSVSFQQYLRTYEESWQSCSQRPLESREYEDRTLYTTLNLSYTQLEFDHPQAAQMLQLLAYFDNESITYELLAIGNQPKTPSVSVRSQGCICEGEELLTSLSQALADRLSFEGVMRTLYRFSFIETQGPALSYRMHNLIHHWTLTKLNKIPDKSLYWYAFGCAASSTAAIKDLSSLAELQYAQLAVHAARLTHPHFLTYRLLHDLELDRSTDVWWISLLLLEQSQPEAAEKMCAALLICQEKVLAPDHIGVLTTVNQLGSIYRIQREFEKAEMMYTRALVGKEKVLGSTNVSTLHTLCGLAALYNDRGKLDAAETMYELALARMEKVLRTNDTLRLDTVHNLADVYYYQGRLAEAEASYKWTLTLGEEELGHNHISNLITVDNIGKICFDQGRFEEAKRMYRRSLDGKAEALGPYHVLTLSTVCNLGYLHRSQGHLDEAERMFSGALAGQENSQGRNLAWTLTFKSALAIVYIEQGKSDEARPLFEQVRTARHERMLADDDPLMVGLIHNLAILYKIQNRLEEAERVYWEALEANKGWFAPWHPKIGRIVRGLCEVFRWQGRDKEAAELEQRHADPERAS